MSKENIKTKLKEFIAHSSQLGETAIKLARIRAIAKTVQISSLSIVLILFSFIAAVALLFLSVALALWLGHLVKSLTAGFLIVGGFYVLLFAVLLLLKDKILLPFLRNRIVKKIYE
jgi:Putative Actinobacterial Holin-X, holin superfamily III